MIFLISGLYILNLIMLLFFYMHMFQLNSYLTKKHIHWLNTNKKIVIRQIIFITAATILTFFNKLSFNILACLFLVLNVLFFLPKKNSKIALKFTHRVLRLYFTELLLIFLIIIIKNFSFILFAKLGLISILTPILCMLANYINLPLEKLVKQKYINEAKKILKGMPNLIVIGVTGSYGKTSVKNFLYKTLSSKYEVLITPKNYNTPMGVVKTIRENLKPTHQIFICEMGAEKLGEIKEICDIVNPTFGVITSIGPQHLETFKSIENIIKTKFELACYVAKNKGKIFLNYDNEYIANHEKFENMITYGANNDSLDFNAFELKSSSKGLTFKIKTKEEEEVQFSTKIIGKHNIVNLTGAIAVANCLGIELKNLVPKIREINSVEHRLQLIQNGNITIIDDSYNSNPISSKSALDTLNEFDGIKIIVTPGMIELGQDEKKYNFEFGKYMTDICDYIFLVGVEHYKPILEGILSNNYPEEKVFIVKTPNEAMNKITSLNLKENVTVLLENDLPDNYN